MFTAENFILTADIRRQAQTIPLLWPTLARVKLHALRASLVLLVAISTIFKTKKLYHREAIAVVCVGLRLI